MSTVEAFQTRAELEEAMTRFVQEAKKASDAGNTLLWAKRHEQINDQLDEWRWVREFVG